MKRNAGHTPKPISSTKSAGRDQVAQGLGRGPSVPAAMMAWAQRSMSATPRVQAKLKIGEPDDAFEQEADAFAARAINGMDLGEGGGETDRPISAAAPPTVQPKQQEPPHKKEAVAEEAVVEETRILRPKLRFSGSSGGGTEAPPNLPGDIGNLRGKGSGLPTHLRGHYERLLGSRLGGVRIHTGADSAALNQQIGARAFTLGQDIFFGQGQYNAASQAGQELIAHEVAHTVQQGSGEVVRRSPWGRPAVTSVPGSCYPNASVEAIERENRAKLRFFEEWLRRSVAELKGGSQYGLKAAIMQEIERLDLTDSYIRAAIGTILSTELTNDRLIFDVMRMLPGMAREYRIAKQADESLESKGIRSPLFGPAMYVLADVACSMPGGMVRLAEAPPIFVRGLIEGLRGSVSSDEIAKIAAKLTAVDAIVAFPFNFTAGFVYGLGETVVKIGKEIIDLITDPAEAIKEIFDLVMALAGEGGEEVAKKMGTELGRTIGKEIGKFADKGASDIVREIGRLLAPLLAAIIIMLMGRTPPRSLIKPEVSRLSEWIVSIKHRLLRRKTKRVKGETDWPLVDHRKKRDGVTLVSDEEHWDWLEKSGQIPADQLDSPELGFELDLVKATTMRKLNPSTSGFVGEVRLPNGRTWRKHEDGSWTRFPEGKRYESTPDGLKPSPIGLPSQFADKAIKTVDDLRRASSTQKPVGRFMKDEAMARDVMQKLAKNDSSAWDMLGIDMKGERFDSDVIEWGLAYDPKTKEYFVIRGNDPTSVSQGAVDWNDYIGKVDMVAHTHPYFGFGGRIRSLQLEGKGQPLTKMLRVSHNQTMLLPSAEDILLMAQKGVDGHRVITPYRYDPEGKVVMNPENAMHLPVIEIEISKPKFIGKGEIFEKDAFQARLRLRAGGKLIEGGEIDLFVLDSPHGPLISRERPMVRTHASDTELPATSSKASVDLRLQLRVRELANDAIDSLMATGKLPGDYVTKAVAKKAGWEEGKSLGHFLPNKQIGGDVFRDELGLLPTAPGREWREADIGIDYAMKRKNQPGTRLLYSNDGLLYMTWEHYDVVEFVGRYKK